jgi:hypothetical protein
MAIADEIATTNTSLGGGRHHKTIPHIATLPNEAISFLTPYSGLLLTLWLVVLFSIKRYALELIFPRIYPQTYKGMDDGLRRGFLVHHISAGTKVVLLIVGAKPFSDVVFGHSTLGDRFSHLHARPTMGDILLVLTQLFVALYVFELLIRKAPSPIAVLHHAGAIIIAQSAVVLSLRLEKEGNATMEFVLCLVWAAFDVLAELWLNVAFILYRIYPRNANLLAYVFGSTFIVSVMGTVAETVMIMTLFGQSWDKWDLSFKVITPILHILFTIAQLHAARILLAMWAKQKNAMADEEARYMDVEAAESKKVFVTTMNATSGADNRLGAAAVDDSMIAPTTSEQERSTASSGSASAAPPPLRGGQPAGPRKKKSFLATVDKFFTGR